MSDNKKSFKLWETALLIAVCFSLCVGTWAQSRQETLSGSLVRLHVIAASDEPEEQSLKLRVRDAVLKKLSPELEGINSPEAALERIIEELHDIKATAEQVSEGRSVRVELGEEYYPTRHYEGFSLPAGNYRSLRVVLGEGKGHNWWCVVFPPLCVNAAERREAVSAMDKGVGGIVAEDGEYKLGFRILELWGELKNLLNIED